MPKSPGTLLRLPLLLLLVAAAVLHLTGALDRADAALADRMLARHAQSRTPPPDIVLVAIDQKSLEDLNEIAGAWPWPRVMHGELVDGLSRWRPQAVVFDVMFNEPDVYRNDSDVAFRDIVSGLDNLYFASLRMPDGNPAPFSQLPARFGAERGPQAAPDAAAPLLLPLVLAPESWQGGLINFEADPDGVGRHARLRHRLQGWTLPGMAARVASDAGAVLPAEDRIRLNWFGQAPRTIPYADLIEDLGQAQPRIAPTLEGAIVVVGATAPGLNDLRPTPLSALTPGAQIITTTLANLRAGDWLRDLPLRWPLAAVLAAGLVAGFLRRKRSPLVIGLWLVAASLASLAGAYALYDHHWHAPVGAALLLAWLGFGLLTIEAHRQERRDREATVGIFGRFLDPRVVEHLVEAGELQRDRKPEAREISILFSDIRGFTTLSETRTPEAVVDLLNRYFTRQVDVIFSTGGTLDKFIGDAIMAFWNAPTDTPGHARQAVAAAIGMTVALDEFKRELAERGEGLGDFDVGVGVHTGPAVVGFLGSDTRMEYTAIGDTVNLASRIEGTTKGVARVLVSDATRAACGEDGPFEFIHRGQFRVKGREQPVDLYEPVTRPHP